MRQSDDIIFKICAAPIGDNGQYHAWPDKLTFVRRFASAELRDRYWRRYVAPRSTDFHGLPYQIVQVNEWSGGWQFVGRAVYAEVPLIGRPTGRNSGPIVECG